MKVQRYAREVVCVLVSQVTPYGTAGVGATTLLTSVKSSNQAARTTLAAPKTAAASKAFDVELSGTAQARSLRLQGYSARMISVKLGLDMTTVNQYLGVTEPSIQSTYVEPKATYQEPRALTQGREELGADVTRLNLIRYTWATMADKSRENVLLA